MTKNKILKILTLLIFFIISLIFIYHNDFLYKEDIGKIIEIKNINQEKINGPLGQTENHIIQNIKIKLTNNKKNIITIKHNLTSSLIDTNKYHINDKVIIKNNRIKSLKRDFNLALISFSFIFILYIVLNKRGLLSFISIIINITILIIALILYKKGFHLLLIMLTSSIFITIISLYISNGNNKKTLIAIISTLISLLIFTIIILIIAKLTKFKGINFHSITFLTTDPEIVFITELIIGGLGAIMDISISIVSSIDELFNKKIKLEEIKKSSDKIASDIIDTMINVIFFTYLSSSLPHIILALSNGYSLINYIKEGYSLEIARFLSASISLLISIIIAKKFSILMLKEKN